MLPRRSVLMVNLIRVRRMSKSPTHKLERLAAQIAIDWQDCKDEIFVSVPCKDVVVELRVRPREFAQKPKQPTLTDCQRDVLEVLAAAHPDRLTKPQIVSALDKQNRIHGESTISLALKVLAERGRVVLPRPSSKDGYGIKEIDEAQSKTDLQWLAPLIPSAIELVYFGWNVFCV